MVSLLVLFQVISAFAQTTASRDQQRIPLVASPKDMTWKVVVTTKAAKDKIKDIPQDADSKAFPPTGTLLQEENTLTGTLRKQTTVFSDGALTRYAKDSLVLYFDPRVNEVVVERNGEDVPGGMLRASRFSECSWIKPIFHKNTQIYEGISCDVYEAPWSGVTGEADSVDKVAVAAGRVASKSLITAYIDQKTRLPVALIDPTAVRTYTFSPASNPVALPKEFSDALQRVEAALHARRQRFNLEQ